MACIPLPALLQQSVASLGAVDAASILFSLLACRTTGNVDLVHARLAGLHNSCVDFVHACLSDTAAQQLPYIASVHAHLPDTAAQHLH